MSTLAYVRDASQGTLDYEGQVFGYSFELLEKVKNDVGLPNPMSYAVDENELVDDDELDEIIEQAEEDGEDSDEAEDRVFTERGTYFDKQLVLDSLNAYQHYFAANPELIEGKVRGEQLAIELLNMIKIVEKSSDKVRLYLA